jgi:hypothetical protein
MVRPSQELLCLSEPLKVPELPRRSAVSQLHDGEPLRPWEHIVAFLERNEGACFTFWKHPLLEGIPSFVGDNTAGNDEAHCAA